ncbi:MAG: hypothetical protein HRU26_05740 [Psychroserpens sp.]|nr:hypothetical protein [Psychroserpens sp.]
MRNNLIFLFAGAIIMFFIMRSCEGEPKIITKTETKIEWKTDTVKVKEIQKLEKPVFVEKINTIKGKDSIIYVNVPTDSTIIANQFKTELKSNEAKADLTITSTGEVLDVFGTITYPEKETITEITKIKDASGFYLYGESPINSKVFTPEIGIQYNIKNKMFISSGVQYNNLNNNLDVKLGIGIKLF